MDFNVEHTDSGRLRPKQCCQEGGRGRRASPLFAVVSVSVVNCGHLRDACSAAQLGRIYGLLNRLVKTWIGLIWLKGNCRLVVNEVMSFRVA